MDMAEWELVDDRFFFRPDGIVDMKHFNPIANSSNPKEANKEAEAIEEVTEKIEPCLAGDQDLVSQVFFNKGNKNEFVDMKMGSPPRTPTREMKPQLDLGLVQFEEEKSFNTKLVDDGCEPEEEEEESNSSDEKQGKGWWEGGDLTILKWKIHGVGALCSIGVVAAATLFIFFIGSRHRQKRLQNQRPRFQIYPEDQVFSRS